MDSFKPKERAVIFSKIERDRFQSLIKKHKDILFSKKTDNLSNNKKNRAWAAIYKEFNAGGVQTRTLRQLKFKFDTMKNARKDATQAQQSKIRTGGGSPAPPVKQETEYIRTVMPVSIDGLPSVVDDAFIENQATVSISKNSQKVINLNPRLKTSNIQANEHKETMNPNENIIHTVSDTDMLTENVFDSNSPAALLKTPTSKSLRIHKRSQYYSETKRYVDLKFEILAKTREDEDHIHKLRIKHMEEKRKEEREIYELQKKKLILEIILLDNK